MAALSTAAPQGDLGLFKVKAGWQAESRQDGQVGQAKELATPGTVKMRMGLALGGCIETRHAIGTDQFMRQPLFGEKFQGAIQGDAIQTGLQAFGDLGVGQGLFGSQQKRQHLTPGRGQAQSGGL